VAEDGTLSLAPRPEKAVGVPAEIVWSVAVRNGAAYLGTGSAGRILRVSDEGEVEEFYDTGEMNVHALAFGEGGDLYAATSPRGRLFRITADGEGELVCDLDCVYLWALAIAADGTVYVGAGAPARIYALGADGEARLAAELPAANVLSLSLAESGRLYAGTSANGVVYRVESNGDAHAVCQVSGRSVDCLAVGAEGDLFASASPGGDIWRIPGQGAPELYASSEQGTIYDMSYLPSGDLVAATGPGGLLVRVGTDRRPQIIFRPETGVATAMAEAHGDLYVGSSGPSLLRTYAAAGATAGSIESAVLDPERPAQWGRASWTADIPEGAEVKVETRSGNSPDPDDNWSPWAPTAGGFTMSPAGRYLQYRVLLTAETPESGPLVRQIHLSHRPQNRPPVCQIKDPEANQALTKKHTIKWQGRDPDKDTLVYDLAVSSDLGKTWDDLETGLTEAKHEWDISDEDDGRYLLRVTASDRRSVPDDPRSAEAEAVVWIDNTAPDVVLLRSSVAVDEEGRAVVTGMAIDALCELRGIEYRVDDGKWHSLGLTAVGGSVSEIAVATEPLEPGTHELEVRGFDAAGNHASDTVSITVEEGEVEEAEETGTRPAEADESPPEPGEGEGEATEPAEDSDAVADPEAAEAADQPDGAEAPHAPTGPAGEEGVGELPGMAAGGID
jgi:hypothetical protein